MLSFWSWSVTITEWPIWWCSVKSFTFNRRTLQATVDARPTPRSTKACLIVSGLLLVVRTEFSLSQWLGEKGGKCDLGRDTEYFDFIWSIYIICTCISYFFSRIVSTWFFTFEIKVYQERSENSGYPWRIATERGCMELLGCYSCSVSWSECWIHMHIQLVAIHHNCKLMIWALFCVCYTSSRKFSKKCISGE